MGCNILCSAGQLIEAQLLCQSAQDNVHLSTDDDTDSVPLSIDNGTGSGPFNLLALAVHKYATSRQVGPGTERLYICIPISRHSFAETVRPARFWHSYRRLIESN